MKLTRDEDEDVRAAAIRVVGKLAPTGSAHVMEQLMFIMLNDESEEAVIAAGKALEGIAVRDLTTTQKLLHVVERLYDAGQMSELAVAIRALGKVSLAGDKNVEEAMLQVLLSTSDKQSRQAAVRALKRTSLGNERVLIALFQALKDESWGVRLAAVDAVVAVCSKDVERTHTQGACEQLLLVLESDEHMLVRERSATGLCAIGVRGTIDNRRLLQVFERDEFAVQVTVMRLLGKVAKRGDEEVVARVVSELDSGEVNMRLEALAAVRKIGNRGDPVICARLLRDLTHRLGAVRALAVQVLGEMAHRNDKEAVQALGKIVDACPTKSFRDMARDSEALHAVEALVHICRSIEEEGGDEELNVGGGAAANDDGTNDDGSANDAMKE